MALVLHKVPVAMVLMAMIWVTCSPPCGMVGLGGVWVVSTCGMLAFDGVVHGLAQE